MSTNPVLYKKYANQTDFTNASNLVDNMVQLVIFYETLSYVVVEEKAKLTLESLIGTLGAHLHLFLGMSFLSFIELFELIIVSISFSFFQK